MHIFGNTSRMQGRDDLSPETNAENGIGSMQSQETCQDTCCDSGRRHGRWHITRKTAAACVSVVAIIAILSAVAVMRDNTGINAESAGRYSNGVKESMQDSMDAITGSAAALYGYLDRIASTASDNSDRLSKAAVRQSGLLERLESIDGMLSDIRLKTEGINSMLYGGVLDGVSGGILGGVSGSGEGSYGSGSVSGGSASGGSSSVDEGVLSDISELQTQLWDLIEKLKGGGSVDYAALYADVSKLQETLDGLAADLYADLSEAMEMVSALRESSQSEHQDILDAITGMQDGLLSSLNEMSDSISGLVDQKTAEVIAMLSEIGSQVADTRESLEGILSMMQDTDVANQEEIRSEFASAKEQMSAIESKFVSAHEAVQASITDFKDSQDSHHAEVVSVLNLMDADFTALMTDCFNNLTAVSNAFESSMNDILASMWEHIDGSFADTNENLDINFSDTNASMDDQFASTNSSMNDSFSSTNTNMDNQFTDTNTNMDSQFASTNTSMNSQFADTNKNMDDSFGNTNTGMTNRFDMTNTDMESNFGNTNDILANRFLGINQNVMDQFMNAILHMNSCFSNMDTVFSDYAEATNSDLDEIKRFLSDSFDAILYDVTTGKANIAAALAAKDFTGNNAVADDAAFVTFCNTIKVSPFVESSFAITAANVASGQVGWENGHRIVGTGGDVTSAYNNGRNDGLLGRADTSHMADSSVSPVITYYYHQHSRTTTGATATSPGRDTPTRQPASGGCWTKAVYHMHNYYSTAAESYTPDAGSTSAIYGSPGGCYGGAITVMETETYETSAGAHGCDTLHQDTSDDGIPDHCAGVCNACGSHGTSTGCCSVTATRLVPRTKYTLSCGASQSTPIGFDLNCNNSAGRIQHTVIDWQ